jgi:hypothetical protein
MKKLPLALISLAIAGTLLMPYFTGKIAERETNHLVSNMNHHFAAMQTLKLSTTNAVIKAPKQVIN